MELKRHVFLPLILDGNQWKLIFLWLLYVGGKSQKWIVMDKSRLPERLWT